jgi:pyruvate dehydrogenase E2 component (dihydrolipoamide acetyltransferase)
VRKFARELGADLGRIRGSGQKGRITEDDVKRYVKAAITGAAQSNAAAAAGDEGGRPWPSVVLPDFAQFGPIEIKPLSRVQRISGPRLHASWVNLPHVTQFDEADITELEETRKGLKSESDTAGVKLTPLAFIVRACVKALHEFPRFNSSLDARGENLILKKYFHVGFAADTPHGLMVPVIRDANRRRRAAANSPPATCRAAASQFRTWARSAAQALRPSSTRPRWPYWAYRVQP